MSPLPKIYNWNPCIINKLKNTCSLRLPNFKICLSKIFGVDNRRNDLKMSFMSKTTIMSKPRSQGGETDQAEFEIKLKEDEDKFDLSV